MMAGNSQRRGAVRKSVKGNPTAGSGGQRRRGLEGKGPTPRAEDRPHHKKHRMVKAAQKRQQAKPKRTPGDGGPEWVAGRNPVLELLRSSVPVSAVYVADGAERDDRLREIFGLAADHRVSMLEVGRTELDQLTGGANHQGIAAKLDAYEYAHPDDLPGIAAERGEPPLIVVLDQVTDPRNLGAIVRSAAGFDKERGDLVEVVNLRFAEAPSQLPLDVSEAGLFDLTKRDLFYFAELGVIVLLTLLTLLFVVRPLVRKIVDPDKAAQGQPVEAATAMIAGPDGEMVALPAPSQEDKTDWFEAAQAEGESHANSIERVGGMIETYPNEALSIVRSWLNEAAA